MKRHYLLLVLCVLLPWHPLWAYEPISLELKEGWEYRWGDSPFEGTLPLWTQENQPEAWKPIDFPSNPPNRNGQNHVWYRVKLPENANLGDSLYIYSIDLVAEVYLEGEKIYYYGDFLPDGTAKFVGWPWHMITLPRDYPGKYLYFRIYSDYPDIGLWGEVVLGNEGAHIKKILQVDALRLATALFFIFFAVVLLGLSLYRKSGMILLLGVCMFNLGFESLQATQAKQLLLFAPVLWQYLGAANYFLIPATLAGLIQYRYGAGRYKLVQWVWVLHLLFVAYAMIFPLQGWINLSSTYIQFDVIALFTVLFLAIRTQQQAGRGKFNNNLLAFGFWLLYIFWVFDGLTAHDIVPFLPQYNYVSQMVVALLFGLILVREYEEIKKNLRQRTLELEQLNTSLETRILERTRQLDDLLQQKDRFFSIIAHDLKGPLGSLVALMGVMKDDKSATKEELLSTLYSMEAAGKNIERLLYNLLELARLQLGEMPYKPKLLPLVELGEAVLGIYQLRAQEKGIRLQNQLGDLKAKGDAHMVETILRNLVSNALKYTHKGGSVTLRAEVREGWAVVLVTDTGVGIDPKTQAHLFALDEKISTPGTQEELGTGLGLVLCREFVERHGGHIGVDSEPGQGSTFWFSLPLE